MTEIWGEVKESLEKTLGADDYRNWIADIDLKSIDSGVATLEAPTQFTGDWVSKTYGDHILQAVREVDPGVVRLYFVVRTLGLRRPERVKQTRSLQNFENGLPEPNLVSRFTFSEFVVGKPNAVAHAAAVRVAYEEGVAFNPLFLYGEVGMGKTHLMHAIGWALKAQNPELRLIYLSAEQFMHQFIRALRTQSIMDFKEMFRSVNVLMVDDVQFIAGKDSTQEEFFHTFNALVGQEKQIILSGDRSPGKIEGLKKRICSRLQSGLTVELHPADYELRLGILQQKAEALCERSSDLVFDPGVLAFLARRIVSNVRVLEGALNRLAAAHSYLKSPIDLNIARTELSDILRDADRRTGIRQIIQCVADYYNVKTSELIGKRRTRNVVRPRQIAIFLAKSLTTKSLPDIGREFNRDHTTVIHSITRIETLRATDSAIAEDIDLITRRLES